MRSATGCCRPLVDRLRERHEDDSIIRKRAEHAPKKVPEHAHKPHKASSLVWRLDDLVEVFLPSTNEHAYGTIAKLRGEQICVKVQVSGGGWWLEWRDMDSDDLRLIAYASRWGVQLGPRPDC